MKRVFSLFLLCLLLLPVAVGLAMPRYGGAGYQRYGGDGKENAALRLYNTPKGVFAQVRIRDPADYKVPLLQAVGVLEDDTLLLYDFKEKKNSEVTQYTTYGGQTYINGEFSGLKYPQVLECELRLKEYEEAVLMPTSSARKDGDSTVGNPDICGSYMFGGIQLEGLSGQLALHFLRELGPKDTGIALLPMYTYQFGRLGDEPEGSPMRRFMGMDEDPYADEGAYAAVYVYKYDTLLMSYYVHPMLLAAYRVTPAGEVQVVAGDEAEE